MSRLPPHGEVVGELADPKLPLVNGGYPEAKITV
jgi:hypothetical protein